MWANIREKTHLKIKRYNVDGYGWRSCKVLKSSSEKTLREEKSRYPEHLEKKTFQYQLARVPYYEDDITAVWDCDHADIVLHMRIGIIRTQFFGQNGQAVLKLRI